MSLLAALLSAFAAAAIAAVAGFLLGSSRGAAAQARVEELRGQVDSARQGFDGLREKLERSESSRIEAETRLANAEKNLDSQMRLLEEAKAKLTDAFKSVAAAALADNNRGFLTLAEEKMRALKAETEHGVEKNKMEISQSVSEMKERVDASLREIRQFEGERREMYAKLEQSMGQISDVGQAIRMETNSLKRALTSSSGTRGSMGEMILQQLLEENGFLPGTHYEMQVRLADGDARPDFVLNLPGNRSLIIDSKEVAGEYLLSQETDDPARQREHVEKLVQNIRSNFTRLGKKEYQDQLDGQALPFVVMFVSSEGALRAALGQDPSIFREACEKKVYLASPFSIIPLIQLVKSSWQQHQLATNARELGDAVEELGNRVSVFVKHIAGMRDGIEKTAKSWDQAMGSWEKNVSPQFARARSLGGRLKETEPLDAIETRMRLPQSDVKNQ